MPLRGARQRGGLVEDEAAEVGRVEPVGVLGRVHQFQHAVHVDALGQRQLDDVAGAGRVLVQFADDRLDLLLRGRGGQLALDGGDADLPRSRGACRQRTSGCRGRSPTRSVPRPGVTPFSLSASTRAVRSDLIAAAVALPSRIWAVIPPSSRIRALALHSGPFRSVQLPLGTAGRYRAALPGHCNAAPPRALPRGCRGGAARCAAGCCCAIRSACCASPCHPRGVALATGRQRSVHVPSYYPYVPLCTDTESQ